VLIEGRQTCAWLVAMGQVEGREIETVESLGDGNGGLI
jgi:aerobic-type carbon monoxide dehydrogenase small subunit (CoxS/CutS family)